MSLFHSTCWACYLLIYILVQLFPTASFSTRRHPISPLPFGHGSSNYFTSKLPALPYPRLLLPLLNHLILSGPLNHHPILVVSSPALGCSLSPTYSSSHLSTGPKPNLPTHCSHRWTHSRLCNMKRSMLCSSYLCPSNLRCREKWGKNRTKKPPVEVYQH